MQFRRNKNASQKEVENNDPGVAQTEDTSPHLINRTNVVNQFFTKIPSYSLPSSSSASSSSSTSGRGKSTRHSTADKIADATESMMRKLKADYNMLRDRAKALYKENQEMKAANEKLEAENTDLRERLDAVGSPVAVTLQKEVDTLRELLSCALDENVDRSRRLLVDMVLKREEELGGYRMLEEEERLKEEERELAARKAAAAEPPGPEFQDRSSGGWVMTGEWVMVS